MINYIARPTVKIGGNTEVGGNGGSIGGVEVGIG